MKRWIHGLAACAVLIGTPATAAVGDVNMDGAIDLADALALCRQLSGEGGTVADPDAADVNGDGTLDETDVRLLMRASLGEPLPARTFSVDPPRLDFLNVLVGASPEQMITLTSDGTSPLDVSSVSFGAGSAGEFTLVLPPTLPATLGPGGSLAFTVRYAPTGAGDDIGSLEIMTNAGDVSIPLLGVAISPKLEVTPANVDFGDVDVGSPVAQMVTIGNTGGAPLDIRSVAPAPATSPDFSVGAPTVRLLAPGESTTVTLGYTPVETGEDNGRIDILTDGGNASVHLFGRGVAPELALQPDALAFGNVLVATTSTLDFDIRNTGNAPLEVSGVALQTGSSDAFLLGAFPGGAFTVLPGEAQAIPVDFTPTGSGPATAAVELSSNAGAGLVSLIGAGVLTEILLSPASADFGNVIPGETPSIDIEIHNVGTAPLDIDDIALSTATSTEFILVSSAATPLTLAPGAMTTASVQYGPGQVGPDSGDLRVLSNDPLNPLATAPLLGNGVLTEFVLQPAALNFSNVRTGETGDLDFEILNSGTAELDIISIAVRAGSDPSFTLPAPLSLPVPLTAGDSLVVAVRYGPTASGTAAGIVDVGTGAGVGEVPLLGTGTEPDIRATPSSLDFGSLPVGSSSVLVFEIFNDGSARLDVGSIAPGPGADPEFDLPSPPALPLTIPAGGSRSVAVEFSPASSGGFTGSIRILSDDPDQATLDVPLTGNAMGGALLGVSPVSVDFGDVPVGTPAMTDVTLSNLGDEELTITGAALGVGSSDDFSVGTPTATVLAAGAVATVNVTYQPGEAGPDTGALELSTDVNFVSVPLAGNGMQDVTPVGLSLNLTHASLAVDDCLQVRATIEFSDGSSSTTTGDVTWTSDAESVATVDEQGLAIAVGEGSATIMATLDALSAAVVLDVGAAGAARLVVPCGELATGATFAAGLQVDTGTVPLGAYGIRLIFDPALVTIQAIQGAAGGPFARTPFFNPSELAGGNVLLAAYQASSLSTPMGVVQLARIEFEVTGAAGGSGTIGVQIVELVSTDLVEVPATTTPARIAVQP